MYFLLTLLGCFDSVVPVADPKTSEEETSDTDNVEEPAAEPSTPAEPTSEPSTEPATEPSTEPSTEPATEPATEPSAEPSEEEPVLPSYAGGYNVNPCSSVQPTGYGVGQVAYDFALTDQYGETLHLEDFCGNAILLVSAAFW